MAFNVIPIDELKKYTDETTVLVIDYDQVAFESAAAVEKRQITAINKAEGIELVFKNKSEFYGRKKKVIEGWLGKENELRVSKGLAPYLRHEWEIQPQQLAPDVSHAYYAAKLKINSIQEHLGIYNYFGVLGKGETFRHELPLPQKYKSNRDEVPRPLLLKETRDYIEQYYPTQVITKIEADDMLTRYGYAGRLDFDKTGKISYLPVSFDKDNNGSPCVYFNQKRINNEYKYPNPRIIGRELGEVWMEGPDLKGYGLFWIACQMCNGDSSDNIRPYQDFGIRYGDKSCYEDLTGCKTEKELLSKVLWRFKTWFPEGVEYTDWRGNYQKMSSLDWAEMMFKLVYMHRIENDKTTFTALLKHYGVEV